MNTVQVMIELPEELIERARTVGLQIETQTDQIVALLEVQISRQQAVMEIRETARQLQSLPPELKPTPEEIEAEIKAYWAENSTRSTSDK
jgi:hypothetical protein